MQNNDLEEKNGMYFNYIHLVYLWVIINKKNIFFFPILSITLLLQIYLFYHKKIVKNEHDFRAIWPSNLLNYVRRGEIEEEEREGRRKGQGEKEWSGRKGRREEKRSRGREYFFKIRRETSKRRRSIAITTTSRICCCAFCWARLRAASGCTAGIVASRIMISRSSVYILFGPQ